MQTAIIDFETGKFIHIYSNTFVEDKKWNKTKWMCKEELKISTKKC